MTTKVVNIPNIVCVSCGNPRITSYYNRYLSLLASGIPVEIASYYLQAKYKAKLCCINSVKSPSVYDEPTFKYSTKNFPTGIKRESTVFNTVTLKGSNMKISEFLNKTSEEKKVAKKP
jgi:hypothetical protein